MKPKPCPCCGRKKPFIGKDEFSVSVICPDWKGGCGLRMIRDMEIGLRRWKAPSDTDWVKEATDKAIEAWNKRTPYTET